MPMEPRPSWARSARIKVQGLVASYGRWLATRPPIPPISAFLGRLYPCWVCGVCGNYDVECVCPETAGCDCLSDEANAARTAAGWPEHYGACIVFDEHIDRWKLDYAREHSKYHDGSGSGAPI